MSNKNADHDALTSIGPSSKTLNTGEPAMSIYKPFKPTFLYIKQHTITGLMYFGKTTKNPEKYLGSGSYWVRHIKKHGKQYVINLWYCLFYNELECREFALQFSKQHNIVESKEWANQIPEQVEDTNNTAGFSPAIDNKNNNLLDG
jgi:hypothetical protein